MRQRKLFRYVLIGGFASNEKYEPKTVLLYEGNGRGEKLVQRLATFPAATKYDAVKTDALAHAVRLGVKLGRNFTAAEGW